MRWHGTLGARHTRCTAHSISCVYVPYHIMCPIISCVLSYHVCMCRIHALVARNTCDMTGNDTWSCMHAGVCGAVVLHACTSILQHRLHMSAAHVCSTCLQHISAGASKPQACQISSWTHVGVCVTNRQEAARFEDARYVATDMVDLAASWHMLELHVTVREESKPHVLLAQAISFRVRPAPLSRALLSVSIAYPCSHTRVRGARARNTHAHVKDAGGALGYVATSRRGVFWGARRLPFAVSPACLLVASALHISTPLSGGQVPYASVRVDS